MQRQASQSNKLEWTAETVLNNEILPQYMVLQGMQTQILKILMRRKLESRFPEI